jgi:hypothetical protein
VIRVEEPTGVYKLPKRFIREHGGEVDWRGSRWYVTLGGRTIKFPFDGWCPLDTLKVPKVANPQHCDDYHEELREDAIFMLTAMFDRDDVQGWQGRDDRGARGAKTLS